MSTPSFPLLAKPALNQTIAIVQRYQAQAISSVNAQLAPIEEFHKGPRMRTAFPWMTVVYDGTQFREASQNTREQHLVVVVQLEVGNFDSELAQDQAIDYLRVLDAIFTYLAGPPPSFQDWESALPIVHETVPSELTVPWKRGTVKEIFAERHEQQIVTRSEESEPIMQVSMSLRFDLEEV